MARSMIVSDLGVLDGDNKIDLGYCKWVYKVKPSGEKKQELEFVGYEDLDGKLSPTVPEFPSDLVMMEKKKKPTPVNGWFYVDGTSSRIAFEFREGQHYASTVDGMPYVGQVDAAPRVLLLTRKRRAESDGDDEDSEDVPKWKRKYAALKVRLGELESRVTVLESMPKSTVIGACAATDGGKVTMGEGVSVTSVVRGKALTQAHFYGNIQNPGPGSVFGGVSYTPGAHYGNTYRHTHTNVVNGNGSSIDSVSSSRSGRHYC